MSTRARAIAAAPSTDTPRAAYSVLQARVTGAVVAILIALSAAAWWSTVGQARDMAGMVGGLAQVGAGMPNDTGAAVFLGMWVAMMVAMMFPTVAPIVLMHRMVIRKRGEGAWPTVAFVGGYLLVWAAIGLVPLAALIGFRSLSADAGASRWLPTVGGVVMIVAGLYQFTPWKTLCLRACRSPLTFLATHDFRRGARGALAAGISHGAWCLGCCWALMAVLVVVGLMNLVWMGAITIVFIAEKNWRHGVGLTQAVGVALTALGVAIVAVPSLLTSVA